MGAEVTISDIADLFDGPHATPAPVDSGPVFLGIKNFTEDGRLTLSEIRHISDEEFPRWTKRVLPRAGDVVFTYEATLHRYAVIPEGFVGCLGRRTALLRPAQDRVDSRWLLYYFRSPRWRRVIDKQMIVGATVDRIPIERFPSFPVLLPGLAIQRRVASALAAYDDLIEVNERRVRLLDESVRLLYGTWFEQLRYPAHAQSTMAEGTPSGWRRARLDEVAAVNERTLSPRSAPAVVTYIDISSVSTGRVQTETKMPFTTAPSRARRLVQDGDIIWSTVRPERRSYALLTDPDPHLVVSTGFAVLTPKTVPPSWLYATVTRDGFVAYMASIARGTSYPAVTGTDFAPVPLLVPPDAVLAAFDAIAAPAYRQIHTLNRQSRALADARDLLLPRLMDGTLTPPDDIPPDPAAK